MINFIPENNAVQQMADKFGFVFPAGTESLQGIQGAQGTRGVQDTEETEPII